VESEFSKDSDEEGNRNTESYTHHENKHLSVISIQRICTMNRNISQQTKVYYRKRLKV
jgi:hypothetical protein